MASSVFTSQHSLLTDLMPCFPLLGCACPQQASNDEAVGNNRMPHTSSELTNKQHKSRCPSHIFGLLSCEIPRSSPPRQQHRCGG
ncbi:hypothetical protein Ddc_15820 [Ditylenchus destructor]|nr:hypothetical protein Ddc_15820 [Ditylenchus destructor]